MKIHSALSVIALFISLQATAAIIPTRAILQKTSDNTGSGIYSIDQEVTFNIGEETLTVKETWLIESDRTMRLMASGTKELQNGFRLQYLYNGGQKWSVNGTRKSEAISGEFLEKFLNFRNPEYLANSLAQMQIIPPGSFSKKATGRTGADFKNEPEPWVRYSRTGGVVNYAFGTPASADKEIGSPGIWIEQDQFVIRKLRLPSGVEMTADNYSQFARGLSYPRTRTIRWGSNSATIRLIGASTRPATAANLFQASNVDIPSKWDGLEDKSSKAAIREFYSRFR